ncbi:hypothetical protein MKX03_021020 [Papaver bracteatum]|nr:hypothetical protein MKX03_021020 [Papaver bracteatum]
MGHLRYGNAREESLLSGNMGMQTDRVRFNVRGKIFETTATTLASVSRNSMFGAMFDDEWNLQPKEEYFIDRNPDCFSVLLDLLGTGELHVPSNVPEKLLYREAHYYGLLDHVRTAKWGKFDSNRLRSTSSVRGQAFGNCSAIRASPDGGCAVVHGGMVRVYDWMLEEHPPLHLDNQIVNDVEWIDSENVVISVYQNLISRVRGVGGMGVFSSSTGELRHRFQLNYEMDPVKGFSADALCVNSESKIFANCVGTYNYGIGVWDQGTGKHIDLFDSMTGYRFGKVEKIQWLNGSNCLFVKSCINSKRCINLLDCRDKSVVWSWSDDSSNYSHHVADAIPMEESNSICVVSNNEDLGFLDFRSMNKQNVRWNSNDREAEGDINNFHHPKLTFHGGQIFCSMGDSISVYSGGLSQWLLTNSLGKCKGGSIQDFSIGGDRLFALHGEENVFDVWETTSASII